MRTALMIALCATGCFSDRGVVIEVDVGDTGATSVELYIGRDDCDPDAPPPGVSCGAITPPGVANPLAGDMWFRDDLVRYTADVKGHTATFQLKADDATKLPIVIAVGFVPDEQGTHPVGTSTLRDLAIPDDSARIATTTLVGATPVQPEQSDSETTDLTEDRVVVWTKANPQSSCVVVEHWQRGEPPKRDFVVPLGDPDCDDVMSECNATAYHGTSLGGMASVPNCFAGQDGGACVLGSLPCTDMFGPEPGTCVAQQDQDTVCVPSQFCDCASLGPECTQVVINAGVLPHITCTVPTTAEGNPCSNNNSTLLDLDEFYLSGASCDQQPRLGSLQLTAFSTNTNSHNFGGAVMTLESPGSPCHFPIAWKSGTRTSLEVLVDYGVVQLQTGDRISLLPITIHFSPNTCDAQSFTCTPPLNIPDPLWTCAHAQ
jgi:hypothetical protein